MWDRPWPGCPGPPRFLVQQAYRLPRIKTFGGRDGKTFSAEVGEHQIEQTPGRRVDFREIIDAGLVIKPGGIFLEQLGIPDDLVQRGADLVVDMRFLQPLRFGNAVGEKGIDHPEQAAARFMDAFQIGKQQASSGRPVRCLILCFLNQHLAEPD